MKPAKQCLQVSEIEALLAGSVPGSQSDVWEEHISACQHCRTAMAGSIGDQDWWREAELSLIGRLKPEEQYGINNQCEERESFNELLKLLGPTDDPRMLGRIGFYEVLGVLGRGGMGVVFKAFDSALHRFVAIKMLLPHLAASGAARKRFAREGQAIAAVVDDHVMAIHCVDEWQGTPYLVMTYSRGVSLQKRIDDHGPTGVREILRIGMQAAKGLAAAHAQGIVHRDVKPSNILLDQSVERVQLVDFGLARAVDDASLTCSGTLAGTPQYMSPEQARGESVDHRSDLFSLGSVLYAMCVGRAPFRAESSYGVLRLITDKEPRSIREVNTEVPDWLCAIIAKLMSKSPEDRFRTAEEVAIIFERCLAHLQDPMQHELPLAVREFGDQYKPRSLFVSRFRKWFPIMSDKRIVSLVSLLLLLMALLVPWPIATAGNVYSALAFAGISALLAFALALLSRTEYFSRIVLWGFGLTLGIVVVGIAVSVPIWMVRASYAADMAKQAEVEAMQAEIIARHNQALADSLEEQGRAQYERSHKIESSTTSFVHWGKPAESGLQAGMRLSPELKSYRLGQQFSFELLFRNILSKPVPAFMLNSPVYTLEVRDSNGAKLDVAYSQTRPTVGGSRAKTIEDETVALRARSLLLLPASTSDEVREQIIAQSDGSFLVFLNPSQSYRLHVKVRSLEDVNAILKSGEVEFTVEAPDSLGASAATDEGSEIATSIGSKDQVEPKESTSSVEESVRSENGPMKPHAERIINGWPVPNTIEMQTLTK